MTFSKKAAAACALAAALYAYKSSPVTMTRLFETVVTPWGVINGVVGVGNAGFFWITSGVVDKKGEEKDFYYRFFMNAIKATTVIPGIASAAIVFGSDVNLETQLISLAVGSASLSLPGYFMFCE